MKWAATVALMLALAACSREHGDRFPNAVADVTVVDLNGKPIPGVTAIAVAQPNAFVEPLATGTVTGPDGRCTLGIKAAPVYVRGWDPQFRYFTNNFLEVAEVPADQVLPPMQIVMVEGCALDVVLLKPDGTPAADTPVEIMMSHPTRGPWWPAKGATTADGLLHLRSVPPGRFDIEFKTADYAGKVQGAELQPTNRVDLGRVQLKKS